MIMIESGESGGSGESGESDRSAGLGVAVEENVATSRRGLAPDVSDASITGIPACSRTAVSMDAHWRADFVISSAAAATYRSTVPSCFFISPSNVES